MTLVSTQVILTLFIGETYLEAGVFDTQAKTDAKSPALWNRYFYLPHMSLKAALTSIAKYLSEHNMTTTEIFVVSRYLERLQNFRLGGSVAQYLPVGFDGNVTFANSMATSISNPSLIICKETYDLTEAALTADLAQLKKVNPDCDKIVVYKGNNTFAKSELIESFFANQGFQVFKADLNKSSSEIRKTLFFAGVFGTIKELLVDLSETFENVKINIWSEGRWNQSLDQNWPIEKSLDLYFSGQNFLWTLAQRKSNSKNKIISLTHFDFDNWETLTATEQNTWSGPWGPLEHKLPFKRQQLTISPKHEVALDDTSRLQMIKPTLTHESGPIFSGRSVRAMGLDLYADEIIAEDSLHKLIGEPDRSIVLQKVKSQFKALENGQKKNGAEISIQDLKQYATSLIQAQTLRSSSAIDSNPAVLAVGQLAFLFGYKHQPYFWSQSIRELIK